MKHSTLYRINEERGRGDGTAVMSIFLSQWQIELTRKFAGG